MKRLMAVIAVSVGALGLFADVIYVTPDGAGSGASWSDPTSITTAFTQVAAMGGGEIWLKEGFYNLTAALALASDMVVRGGFAGSETSAEAADPKAHPTVLAAIPNAQMASYNWSSNGTRVVNAPLWKDGAFNLCRPDDEAFIYRFPTVANGSYGFANILTTPQSASGVKISGVTLTGSRQSALVVSTTSDVVVENCRFLACGVGTTTPPVAGAISAKGHILVTSSEFVGCSCAVELALSDTSVTNSFRNCLFDANTGGQGTGLAGAVYTTGTTPVEIDACTFKGNVGISRSNNTFSGAAVACYNASAQTIIRDCAFEDNRCRSVGTDTPFGCIEVKGATRIEGCLFTNNSVKGDGLNYAQDRSACIGATGTLFVRDTVFVGNKIQATTTGVNSWGIVNCFSSTLGSFVNCAFYDNEIAVQGSTDAAKAGLWAGTLVMSRIQNGDDRNFGISVINSLFSNNSLTSNVESTKQAEVLLCDDNDKDRPYFTYCLVNTVIWNESKDHRCYRAHPEIDPWITHCDFVNCGDVAPVTNGTVCIEHLTAVDPCISKVCRARGTYTFNGMLGIESTSPFVKAGTPVYEKDGVFYIYEPGIVSGKPWRNCNLKGTSLASLSGASLVADAFGAAREAGGFAYGPFVMLRSGLIVILK